MKQISKLVKLALKSCLILLMLWIVLGLVGASLKLSLNWKYNHSFFLVGIGFCVGLLLFSLKSTFSRTYVVGHELTHWLVAKLFRRKTSGLSIGKRGGSLHVEKPNILIVLAPYFFPLYTVLWLILVNLLQVSVNADWVSMTLYIGIGFTYAFHIVMTILALSKIQNDLKLYGHFFSLCLIFNINLFILYLGLSYFSKDLKTGYSLLKDSFQYQWRLLANGIYSLPTLIKG